MAANEKEQKKDNSDKTLMGKGEGAAECASFEDKVSTHVRPLSDAGACFDS